MLERKIVESKTDDDIKYLKDAINAYNLDKVKATIEGYSKFHFKVVSEDCSYSGGILGYLGYWGGLEIDTLFVMPELRGKGLGSSLLKRMEKTAKANGATMATLDTFDFQALHFYTRHGYECFGELKNFPTGHSRFYLSKTL